MPTGRQPIGYLSFYNWGGNGEYGTGGMACTPQSRPAAACAPRDPAGVRAAESKLTITIVR